MKPSGRAIRHRVSVADSALRQDQGRIESIEKSPAQALAEQRDNAVPALQKEVAALRRDQATLTPVQFARRERVILRLAARVAAR